MRRLACLLSILLAGCAGKPPSLYAWGSYEELIYKSYSHPGELAPEAQADKLEKDRQQSESAKKQLPLPPGWHAHLAYVYVQTGRLDLAERELLAEKAAYPESATFVDSLITNLRKR